VEDLALNPAFWRGRRVLLTGHTGFKGSWLALWLASLGAKITGFSVDIPSKPSLMEAARVGDALRDVRGDVRDLQAVRAVMDEAKPEVVLHLAAQSLVRQSYATPVETYATNVMGTAHVLEAARTAKTVRAVVVVTSDKCYENRESGEAYAESDAMGGHDPYSSSKGAAELVTAAYRRSFFGDEKVASARAGNVIGGGDWSVDRLIPDIYRAAAAREPLRIRNPKAVRPWQHVLEPLSGYLMLAERVAADRAFAQAWNFGPDERDARSVEDVVNRVVARWGSGLRWELDRGAHPHEAKLLSIDSAKARHQLGWAPRLKLEEALEWTVDWYKAFMRGEDVREVTMAQIARYGSMVNV
jgi:CDP-glucose 4,6-dehydratase